MSWSQSELDALRRAYASGTLRITYEGRTVQYDDADGLLKRIKTIEESINAGNGRRRPRVGIVRFSRGDR